jgi:hypothetical protein
MSAMKRHLEELLDRVRGSAPLNAKIQGDDRRVLQFVHHELTTLNGLLATDGAAPDETFTIDTSDALMLVDYALGRTT